MENKISLFERMQKGGLIASDDAELTHLWEVVNQVIPMVVTLNTSSNTDEIRARLSVITGQDIDHSTTIFIPFHTNFGRHIRIGKNVFINHGCTFLDLGGIEIEDDVLIGPQVCLISENHPISPGQRKSLDLKKVIIKKNAWLGANVTVLPGVTIGENAIVAAASVVTKDVADNTIVAGVPARFIKSIQDVE